MRKPAFGRIPRKAELEWKDAGKQINLRIGLYHEL
jgi:hypothetical protein